MCLVKFDVYFTIMSSLMLRTCCLHVIWLLILFGSVMMLIIHVQYILIIPEDS